MAVREILLLGNPALRVRCTPVKSFSTPALESIIEDLRDTLYDFKSRNGFGRGIAAPQIGIPQRIVFVHVERPFELINPSVIGRSRKHMALWDACFSFPNLLVKVKRSISVQVRFRGIDGKTHSLKAEGGLSELLQHEIDHLDGILAIDRAIDFRHIIFRSEYQKLVKDTGILL